MIDDDGNLVETDDSRRLAPTVPALLDYCRERFAANEMIVSPEGRVTYGELDDRSALLARRLLAMGVGKGTRVGMCFGNGGRFLETWVAIARIGALAVPVNTLSTSAELRRLVLHADLHLLITVDWLFRRHYPEVLEEAFPALRDQHGRAPLAIEDAPFLRAIVVVATDDNAVAPAWSRRLDEVDPMSESVLRAAEAQVVPADPVSIIYTSGSTGAPKGVVHSHGTLVRQSAKLLAAWEYTSGDRIYTSMPFFWVGGLAFTLLTTMRAGATIVASPATDPAEILATLETERVTFFLSFHHTARQLGAHPGFASRDLSAMRGGMLLEALPASMRVDDFGLLCDCLGMTETAGPHTYGQLRPIPESLRGSFGRPVPGIEERIVDVDTGVPVGEGVEGEIVVRGDTVMLGLYKRERDEVFDADGWYHTGDLGALRNGHLYFTGRGDDLIKASGANVSPFEVETVLMGFPGVAQAFVVPVPDRERGNIVAAAIVPAGEVDGFDTEALRSHAAKLLSSYKVPKKVRAMRADDLPTFTNGKVDRKMLAIRLGNAS